MIEYLQQRKALLEADLKETIFQSICGAYLQGQLYEIECAIHEYQETHKWGKVEE